MTLGSTAFDNSNLVSSINAYLIRGTYRFVDSPESFIGNFDTYYKEWFFEFHCNNKIVDELRFSGTIDIARYIIANANMSIGDPTTILNDNIVIYCYTKILNNVNIGVKGFNSIIGALKGRHSSELSMVSDILDWDPNISYSTGARVLYNGIKYVASQDSTNIQPDISIHYWSIEPGWTRKPEFIRNIWNSFGVDTTNLSYEMLYRSTWMSSDNNYNAYQFTDKTIDVVVNFARSKLNRCWYNPANITGDKYNKFIELSTNTMFESTNDVRYAYIMFNGARNLTGDIIIENDVWIGAKSTIMSGVTIHSGSVVAATSTVTKDVPPYMIVAGNPAKIVKPRFTPDIIEKLLEIKWWDWPQDTNKIKQEANLMWTNNVEAFVNKHYRQKKNKS
jgi:acetyltransferase-like isoleucine patch superfamily enzyme